MCGCFNSATHGCMTATAIVKLQILTIDYNKQFFRERLACIQKLFTVFYSSSHYNIITCNNNYMLIIIIIIMIYNILC